jgi:hypothetical protein
MVFELSYQERDGWSIWQGFWLSAVGEDDSRQDGKSAVNTSIDQAAVCLGKSDAVLE